jgi:hypothetical protein
MAQTVTLRVFEALTRRLEDEVRRLDLDHELGRTRYVTAHALFPPLLHARYSLTLSDGSGLMRTCSTTARAWPRSMSLRARPRRQPPPPWSAWCAPQRRCASAGRDLCDLALPVPSPQPPRRPLRPARRLPALPRP